MVRGAFGSICRRYNYYEKIMTINKIKVKFLVVAYPALEFNCKVILTDILEDPIQLITEAATYNVKTQLFIIKNMKMPAGAKSGQQWGICSNRLIFFFPFTSL